MNKKAERIVFLYLSTGGGHIGPAKALIADIKSQYGDDAAELYLLDGMPGGNTLGRFIVERGYTITSSVFPYLWTGIYEASRLPFLMKIQLFLMALHSASALAKFIVEKQITKIVNLHFLLTHTVERAIKLAHRSQIPRVTIVSDPFSVHPIWTYRNSMPIIVFSESARQLLATRLARQKMDSSKVQAIGPIVNPKFDTVLDPATVQGLKLKFGFDQHKPLILLAGGGEGFPEAEAFLKGLCQLGLDIQVAMICGRNRAQLRIASLTACLFGELRGDDSALDTVRHLPEFKNTLQAKNRVPVTVYGFVPFMYELMNMSTIILSKAGAGTIFEILSLQKPLIITRYLYGQEKGNVDYVVKNGLGWYAPTVKEMLMRVQKVLTNPAMLQNSSESMKQRELANGTQRISRYIMEDLQ